MDLPDSDRGDFSCRRAVDSSSYVHVLFQRSMRSSSAASAGPSMVTCEICLMEQPTEVGAVEKDGWYFGMDK